MHTKNFKNGLFICFIFLSLDGPAVERVTVIGAREASLSLAVISQPGSFSIFHNQAFLTLDQIPGVANQSISAGVSLRQPFLINGYNESALAVVIPTHDIVFAVGITHSGIGNYSESSFGLALAKRLTRKLSAGLLFNYFTFNLPESGTSRGSFQLDGGLGYQYSEFLSFGLHLRNIIVTPCSTFQYKIAFPILLRAGASCRLTEKILLSAETVYQTNTRVEKGYGFNIRFGMEYLILENFFLRGGVSVTPFQHTVGFGYRWKSCQLDFALVHHEFLGYTPIFSLSCNFTHPPH